MWRKSHARELRKAKRGSPLEGDVMVYADSRTRGGGEQAEEGCEAGVTAPAGPEHG